MLLLDSSGNYFHDNKLLSKLEIDRTAFLEESEYIDAEFSHSSSEISIPFMPDKRFSEVRKIEEHLISLLKEYLKVFLKI